MEDPENRKGEKENPGREQESLADLYERYAPSVAKFFANRRFSMEDVQDLTQDTFVSAFRGLQALRSKDKLEAWIFKIAVNKWRNACRNRATARRYVQEMAPDRLLESEEAPAVTEDRHQRDNPLRKTLLEEEHRLLRDALVELSPPLRYVALLRLEQGLSYEEIAAVLRIPVGTVKSRLNKAAQQLRRSLGAAYGEVRL